AGGCGPRATTWSTWRASATSSSSATCHRSRPRWPGRSAWPTTSPGACGWRRDRCPGSASTAARRRCGPSTTWRTWPEAAAGPGCRRAGVPARRRPPRIAGGRDELRRPGRSNPQTYTNDPGGTTMPQLVPNLWFDGQAEEAANFYVSVFPNSEILKVVRYTEAGPGPAGSVVTVDFSLDGVRFTAINGGPDFTFDEAVSFAVMCKDQDEVDHYWSRLLEGGGQEGPCGWLKDRYGLSWQVVPVRLEELLADPDPDRARRATEAMFTMRKIDIAALEAAADGASAA